MKIICNGKESEIGEGVSIEKLLGQLSLNPDTVVVECDGKIVLRENYAELLLHEGAVLELIRFVGGG